ncbi:hypothetical protein JHK87_003334 [Glycine soja]|nr:hypothetical protein JHK87_003334 [Glycine soja]
MFLPSTRRHLISTKKVEVELYSLLGEQSSSGVSKDVLRFLSNSTRVLLPIGPQITPASLTSLKKVRGKQWKQGGRNMKFNMPICCNGVIHFIFLIALLFRPYIMSYNVESGDTSTMLRVPKDTRRGTHDSSCDMSIFIWGKASEAERFICLVRLRKSVFAVWILTDYESSRWLRNLKVRTKGVVGLREKDPKLTGFTVMNGDLLVFATETRVYS